MNVITRLAVVMTALALVLVACGRSNDGGGASGAASLAPAVSTGPVSGDLTVWAMGTEGEKLGVLAKDFMAENPDVKVKVTAVPWDAAHDKITTAIAGDTTPDVSLIGTTWMGEFAKTGALDATPANLDPKSFFEGAFNTSVVDGTSYGVPWYVETRLIYYRTDLAEKAGFTAAPKELGRAEEDGPGHGREGWRQIRASRSRRAGPARGRPSCPSPGRRARP